MPYDNVVSRTDAAATMPEEVADEILGALPEESAALALFRNRNMGTKQVRLPVKSALPTAYFVNGDTGLKQTTEVNWDNVYLNAEEIACIVPIPDTVSDDAEFDLWDEMKPDIVEAVGRTLDAAIFFNVNKPAAWPTAVVAGAVAAGNVIARGANLAAAGGLAADISDVMGTVEADGFDVNGVIATRAYRGRLRNVRDADGRRLEEVTTDDVYGAAVRYPMRGLWPTGLSAAEMIVGDFTQGIVGIRQDITYKILSEAVIQDDTGAIIYNLAQQDMQALRVVARFAFAVPNPINRDNANAGTRYPFGVLRSPAA